MGPRAIPNQLPFTLILNSLCNLARFVILVIMVERENSLGAKDTGKGEALISQSMV